MQQRRGRGPGKKGSMVHVTLRIPQEVYDFYRDYPSPSDAMRAALAIMMKQYLTKYGAGVDSDKPRSKPDA